MNEIQAKIWRRVNAIYQIKPIYADWFPYFYKRRKYSWEDESRIAIKKSSFTRHELKDSRTIETEFIKINRLPNSKIFIELPFNNDYFTISLKEVIIGRNTPANRLEELKELSNQMGFRLWKVV